MRDSLGGAMKLRSSKSQSRVCWKIRRLDVKRRWKGQAQVRPIQVNSSSEKNFAVSVPPFGGTATTVKPYRQPTLVGWQSIPRRAGEGGSRNSANQLGVPLVYALPCPSDKEILSTKHEIRNKNQNSNFSMFKTFVFVQIFRFRIFEFVQKFGFRIQDFLARRARLQQTITERLFNKNTGLCKLERGSIRAEACPVPEG